ncbi:MAG: glycosyltransferase, partial [Halieaceae bacterium]
EVTAQCLQSIASFPPSVPYEVLVADDAFATPFDPAQFDLTGVTVLRAEQNQGFLRNCNAAVSMSSGDRVLLLNNDTMVLEGAVDALWQTFERFEGVGAVGAKLLYPNGRLQEAGGIIWRDGSGWNWGRDENADAPRFNYVRDADYCSAAALMVDKALWDSVGGFDPRFAPCYYEDTDLCFAIRRQGKRVLYQPAAEVLHFEGVSHGTDISEGAKANQARHQVTFAQKWSRELAFHAPNGERPYREADRGARARILWLEACVITPDQDSGSLRTLRLLRLLLKLGCKVTFAADNLLADEPYGQQLRDEGIEVLHAPHVQSMGEYLRDHGGLYDVVTLCRHYIAIQHVDLLREHHPDTQIWFDTIDLHYLRLRRQHELDQAPATLKMAELAYDEECEVISKSDLTIVVSEVEVAELATEAPDAKVAVISNIHEVARDRPAFDDRSGVMFVGGFQHPPNIDAVEYYANEIWPLLTERCPDLETYVIGSRMPDRLKRLGESRGLKMLGFVEDLTPYYESCMLAIAPLRYGAGVKGKVNQALSFGLPVVGSPVAFEGMGLTHEREVMVAETAEDFAASVAKVCADPALWQTLSERGGASLAGRFTPEVAEAALRDVLELWLDEGDLETVG